MSSRRTICVVPRLRLASARRWMRSKWWFNCASEQFRRVAAVGILLVALVFLVAVLMILIGVPARADIAQMAPQASQRTSVDGWVLSVSLSAETINGVPNLASASNSREAFVSLSAKATIEGSGGNPITSANFVAGYQVGCQIDVSQGLQIGGTGQLAGSVGGNVSAQPAVQVGGTGSIGGFMQTDLQPGVITTIPMSNMPLVTHTGHLDMQDVHLKVDACGGPVTLRSYATMAIGTDIERTQLSVYGDPYVLN